MVCKEMSHFSHHGTHTVALMQMRLDRLVKENLSLDYFRKNRQLFLMCLKKYFLGLIYSM